jgi:hypothetical protein
MTSESPTELRGLNCSMLLIIIVQNWETYKGLQAQCTGNDMLFCDYIKEKTTKWL